jgi:hypothetical protein
VCVCVCVCMSIHLSACMFINTYLSTHTRSILTHINTHTHTHTHSPHWARLRWAAGSRWTHPHTLLHTHTHTLINKQTHTLINKQTHTHTHTHTAPTGQDYGGLPVVDGRTITHSFLEAMKEGVVDVPFMLGNMGYEADCCTPRCVCVCVCVCVCM